MSTEDVEHPLDSSEQIRFVQCGLCSTILLVNVPYNNLSMVVTVRCGNCTGLLSVNMANASFIPLHLLASLTHNNTPKDQGFQELNIHKDLDIHNTCPTVTLSHVESTEDDVEGDDEVMILPPTPTPTPTPTPVVNKPPEKKQRAPSAYNQFIREEIRRLKSENPEMAHKDAFKTAAKNWAHLPPIHGEVEFVPPGKKVM